MKVRSELRKATEELISQLGITSNSIADRLESYGIRGVRNRSSECALARYLQLVTGTDPKISRIDVHRRSVRLDLSGWRRPAARAFVEAFDAGCYPQLMNGPKNPPTSDKTARLPSAAH